MDILQKTTLFRTTLISTRDGCRAAQRSLIREIENHLGPLRATAHEPFERDGDTYCIPYLERVFDGLRDAILLGKDEARIDLVDTKADDISIEMAGCIWSSIAGYLFSIGLPRSEREWKFHDADRRSGIVVLIVPL